VRSLLKFPERLGQKEYGKMLYLQVESTNAAALGLYQKFSLITKINY
jgi:ribosomal protein S18 acetylase RimI-like enzyme